MNGIIKSYRKGRTTQKSSQFILVFDSIKEKSKAVALLGRKLYWESGAGKKVYGKITAVHGGNGAVRAKFVKGLPGTALGEKVNLVE